MYIYCNINEKARFLAAAFLAASICIGFVISRKLLDSKFYDEY